MGQEEIVHAGPLPFVEEPRSHPGALVKAINQYTVRASARGAAKATVTAHLQALIHFDRFTSKSRRRRGIARRSSSLVDHWMQASL